MILKATSDLEDRQALDSPPMALDLVGIAEVAALLGVSTQRVDQIARQDESFPAPVAELAAGRIWLRPEITEWARQAGRPVQGHD